MKMNRRPNRSASFPPVSITTANVSARFISFDGKSAYTRSIILAPGRSAVVDPDAGSSDDLQPRPALDQLRVERRSRADHDRVEPVDDLREVRGAVLDHVEVASQEREAGV